MSALAGLEPLVGRWTVAAVFPETSGLPEMHGETSFEWVLDGAFLQQTATTDVAEAPDSRSLIGVSGAGYVQHYFDSRGVVRRYAMTFDGTVWTLSREAEPPDFHQFFEATLAGDTVTGAWRRTEDGAWIHDFEISYTRA